MSHLIIISAIAIPLYLIMRRLDLGRLSSQIVAVGGPGIGVISACAWTAHPLAGIGMLILLSLAMVIVLFIVISAEIDD
jgi:hypothetical protein